MDKLNNVKLGFLYFFANDLPSMRHFYTDILGLNECNYFEDSQFGWLCYQMESFQMMWFRSSTKIPILNDWADQPGYSKGILEVPSWSIQMNETQFQDTINTIKEEGYPIFQDAPELRQDSYWGFTVRDPMGNTVELYYIPKKTEIK
ncbi:MAG TPA: VOC family protein [Caldisericia bacterium]|nr:VOC family protein [Caldisericia bacterium]